MIKDFSLNAEIQVSKLTKFANAKNVCNDCGTKYKKTHACKEPVTQIPTPLTPLPPQVGRSANQLSNCFTATWLPLWLKLLCNCNITRYYTIANY